MQDTAKKPRRNVFTSVDRDDGSTSIGMAKVEVTAFLADALKPKTLKQTD